ncbi:hypothetical protein [Christiangramia aestuarii]|uniref:Uncharacterized protein n=1 Tax=Christiangramia aestuarii TaxID=1028746 RepID=A0A7K1LSZ7_9FLAO|nr:hypothetical protein [Christiangramia aestuarii]MUP43932.1 hypothetical protein [Christiangramia aestuarii]
MFVVFLVLLYFHQYVIAFIFLFPVIGWPIKGKLFSLKSISFDDKNVYIDKEKFPLEKISKTKFSPVSSTYIQIDNKKYYFMSIEEDFGFSNKKKILEKLINSN